MSAPALADLQQYNVNRPGQIEVVRQSLYDFQTYNAAGQTQLSFFQVPQGQSGKTKYDTNMEVAGSLPNPKNFYVTSIEILFYPDVLVDTFNAAAAANSAQADDVYTFAKSGYLDFFIGSKSYLTEAPLGVFPPKTRLQVNTAISSNSATVGEVKNEYATMSGQPYILDPGILLVPTQNFNITMNWPAAVALPSTVNARVGVRLNGFLYRNSQ